MNLISTNYTFCCILFFGRLDLASYLLGSADPPNWCFLSTRLFLGHPMMVLWVGNNCTLILFSLHLWIFKCNINKMSACLTKLLLIFIYQLQYQTSCGAIVFSLSFAELEGWGLGPYFLLQTLIVYVMLMLYIFLCCSALTKLNTKVGLSHPYHTTPPPPPQTF